MQGGTLPNRLTTLLLTLLMAISCTGAVDTSAGRGTRGVELPADHHASTHLPTERERGAPLTHATPTRRRRQPPAPRVAEYEDGTAGPRHDDRSDAIDEEADRRQRGEEKRARSNEDEPKENGGETCFDIAATIKVRRSRYSTHHREGWPRCIVTSATSKVARYALTTIGGERVEGGEGRNAERGKGRGWGCLPR